MKQKSKRFILIPSLLILMGAFVTAIYFYWTSDFEISDGSKPSKELIAECKAAGATAKIFSNGCVDHCDYKRNPTGTACTYALTPGCYCGSGKCWNGKNCEPL